MTKVRRSLRVWDELKQPSLVIQLEKGPTAFDRWDTTFGNFFCANGKENPVAFEETGFFATGYALTVSSRAEPESRTTASFEA